MKAGADVPQQFYEERGGGKKVIRLFANVDWSQLTGELWISEEYILAGQGYNITLGEGGSLTCRQEGKLYINKELYVDGVKQEQAENARIFVLADFIPDFANFIVSKVLSTYSDFPVLDEK